MEFKLEISNSDLEFLELIWIETGFSFSNKTFNIGQYIFEDEEDEANANANNSLPALDSGIKRVLKGEFIK